MLESFDDELVSDHFKLCCEIEDLIFEANESSIESAENLLLKNPHVISPTFLSSLLIQAGNVRRFSFKALSKLWKVIPKTDKKIPYTLFTDYLYKLNLIDDQSILWTPNSQTAEEIEDIFDNDSIFYSIIKDDLTSFNEKVASLNPSSLVCKINHCDLGIINIHCIDLAAFCGSVQIFKTLFVYGTKMTKETALFAIRGGNIEIIEILIQNGFLFQHCFEVAIKYHRNDIAYWLSENYIHDHSVDLLDCLHSFNTSAIPFLLSRGANIGVTDESKRSVLHIATMNENINIIQYLISQEANIEAKDNHFSTPLIEAAKNGFLEIVKLLIEKGANINACDYCHQTPLIWAAKNGYKELVIYLLENGSDKGAKDNYGRSSIDLAYSKEIADLISSF